MQGMQHGRSKKLHFAADTPPTTLNPPTKFNLTPLFNCASPPPSTPHIPPSSPPTSSSNTPIEQLEQGATETARYLTATDVHETRSMVSLAPLKIPFPNTMPPAAGTKHEREDKASPIIASISKKRVRFANTAVAQQDFERLRQESEDEKISDSDASTTTSTTTTTTTTTTATNAKKPRIKGASASNMFKKFVANALDERAAVCSPTPLLLAGRRWDSGLTSHRGL